MDPFLEHNSKQASQAEPIVEKIENWDEDDLLKWIQQKHPKLLKDDDLTKLRKERVDGVVFLNHAGDKKYFREECNLAGGTSERLANLARETADMLQKGKEQGTSTDPKARKRKSPPHTDIAPSLKRTRAGDNSLIINGKLKHFQSGLDENFSKFLQREGQAYFDRTRYIFTLHELHNSILFCRPRRFGKSLTVSMLEHFHGLQYTSEHQSLYKGLDVQNDIDEGKVKPGQYFVLEFDFSKVRPNPNLEEANETLIKFLNTSLEEFYETYAAYLGRDFADLCRTIDSKEPNISLQRCVRSVRHAIRQDERLAGIEGIYVLVDEYDAFANNYLEPPKTVGPKTTWEDTAVGQTFKSFWAIIKSLGKDGLIRRIFITGISPLSLSSVGSAFNVARNLSFHRDLAGLCGLTCSDVGDALNEICEDPLDYSDSLSEMTSSFNGYHFCKDKTVKTVYNTETCLAYLQSLLEGVEPETQDPQNSEISEQFLTRFASSAPVIRDFEKALEYDQEGNFTPLAYGRFKPEFTLRDLSGVENHSSWRSLIVYFGGLTFHPEKPKTHLKIPNSVAADRIALAVLEKYDLRNSFEEALRHLVDDGELERTLGCYRELMIQRDITVKDLTQTREAEHRDCFYFCLLRNHYLVPRAEFQVIKPDQINGRIDLLFQVPGRLIVTEWKFYRINFLNVQVNGNKTPNDLTKAAILCNYTLPELLQLGFGTWDKFHHGTIGSWVIGNEGPQLRDYIKSTKVQQLLKERSLELQAHLVIIVGSRHILLWDMDKEGNLATEPCLVEIPSRSNRQDGRGYYS